MKSEYQAFFPVRNPLPAAALLFINPLGLIKLAEFFLNIPWKGYPKFLADESVDYS